MAEENGQAPRPKARADIQMRVVFDARKYADAGELMDAIEGSMGELLTGLQNARFDFVGFQTHPCKAVDMDRLAYDEPQQAMPAPY